MLDLLGIDREWPDVFESLKHIAEKRAGVGDDKQEEPQDDSFAKSAANVRDVTQRMARR